MEAQVVITDKDVVKAAHKLARTRNISPEKAILQTITGRRRNIFVELDEDLHKFAEWFICGTLSEKQYAKLTGRKPTQRLKDLAHKEARDDARRGIDLRFMEGRLTEKEYVKLTSQQPSKELMEDRRVDECSCSCYQRRGCKCRCHQ